MGENLSWNLSHTLEMNRPLFEWLVSTRTAVTWLLLNAYTVLV